MSLFGFLRTIVFSGAGIAMIGGCVPDGPSRHDEVVACSMEAIEAARVEGQEEQEEYQFGQVATMAIGIDGSSYVVDRHPSSVRQFDAEGRFMRWIGGQGEGPGEYRSVAGVSVLPDGLLAVWDRTLGRVLLYGHRGRYFDHIQTRIRAPNVERAFVTGAPNEYYIKVFTVVPGFGQSTGDARGEYGFVRVGRDGSVLDTLFVPGDYDIESASTVAVWTRGGYRSPFPIRVLSALSPMGYYIAGTNVDYTFAIYHPQGAVTVKRDEARVKVSPAERDEWEARVRWSESTFGQAWATVPEWKPAYRDLWVDADGRIWVERYMPAVRDSAFGLGGMREDEPEITWSEPLVLDVYSHNGEFMWCVSLPSYADVLASRGLVVWGVVRDRLGRETIVRWRLRRTV